MILPGLYAESGRRALRRSDALNSPETKLEPQIWDFRDIWRAARGMRRWAGGSVSTALGEKVV